ncbi:MAG: hypothetical protein RIS52_228 [Pseudomonadota bacterium]
MGKMITATGAALLTLSLPVAAPAEPVSAAGQVMLNEAAQMTGDSACNDDDAAERTGRPTAKIATEHAGARGGPKGGGRDKEDVGRAAEKADDDDTPSECAPNAARTGKPKIKEKEATNDRVADPTPATEAAEERREGPKERDKHGHQSRAATPAPGTQLADRKEGPKGDVGSDHQGRTAPAPAVPEAARTGKPKGRDKLATGRKRGPKERDDSPHDTRRKKN